MDFYREKSVLYYMKAEDLILFIRGIAINEKFF